MTVSDFRLLGDFKSVVDLDTQVPHGRFQLGVAEPQLHGSKVLSASIDQRGFGPSHRMGPILGTIQTKLIHPVPENIEFPIRRGMLGQPLSLNSTNIFSDV